MVCVVSFVNTYFTQRICFTRNKQCLHLIYLLVFYFYPRRLTYSTRSNLFLCALKMKETTRTEFPSLCSFFVFSLVQVEFFSSTKQIALHSRHWEVLIVIMFYRYVHSLKKPTYLLKASNVLITYWFLWFCKRNYTERQLRVKRIYSINAVVSRVQFYAVIVGVMKMRNIVPRVGIKTHISGIPASMLPLHHIGFTDVTTIPTTICLCSSLPQRSVQTTTLEPLEL